MRFKNLRFLLISWFLIFAAFAMQSQTIRNITVSYDKSYTDHLSLAKDSRDMDLMVKFVFDEDKNSLTVSLISYRLLFVFREPSRYKNIIHHNRLDPEDLSYVSTFPENSRFILSKEFRNSIPKPHKDYIFPAWIQYTGLQPVPMKYKMVNDYIEQSFDVTNYGTDVTVNLGYVVVMENTSTKKHPDDYTFVAGKDLNVSYRITILRNPCFGLDSEMEIAQNNLSAVNEAYSNLKAMYGTGVMENEKLLKSFNDMKGVLLKQFAYKKSDSPCAELKDTWDSYDSYVDSIGSLTCRLKEIEGNGAGSALKVDPSIITGMARQIDKDVSRWLLSKDAMERRDLEKECSDIIQEINGMIGSSSGSTPEQKKAIAIFRQAEAYFKSTCGKTK